MPRAAGTRRSGSEPPSTRKTIAHGLYDEIMHRNPMMFMMPNPSEATGRFVHCGESDCKITSGAAEFPSMTLRSGLSYCLDHVRMSEIVQISAERTTFEDMTLIFYDLELSKDGEIEQIGAYTEGNRRFSAFIRTSVRTNTSPTLKAIPPAIWSLFAAEPARAIRDFISWISMVHFVNTGNNDPNNVMLTAHNGACHDHIRIVRMMMKHGIDPPNYRLTDTLVLFKVMKGRSAGASLATLRDKYAPWIPHEAHDADSDASVLRYVTMIVFPDTKRMCYPFGISCREYTNRTGMNMYLPSPVVSFKDTFTSLPVLSRVSSHDTESVAMSNHTD